MPRRTAQGGAILDGDLGMNATFGAEDRHSGGAPPVPAGGNPPTAAKRSPLRVLVTDDEALIRWSVTETLSDLGVEVVQADSGRTAIAALEGAERPFDVAVVDLRLPDVADLSLVTRIRQAHVDTAVVVITAFGTPDVLADAQAIGVTAVVSKPFDVHDLARVVLTAGGQDVP